MDALRVEANLEVPSGAIGAFLHVRSDPTIISLRRVFVSGAAAACCEIAVDSSWTKEQAISALFKKIKAGRKQLNAIQSSEVPPQKCPTAYRW